MNFSISPVPIAASSPTMTVEVPCRRPDSPTTVGRFSSGLPVVNDYTVVESFFSTLKRELLHHQKYKTREEVHQSLMEFIEVFYNPQRVSTFRGEGQSAYENS